MGTFAWPSDGARLGALALALLAPWLVPRLLAARRPGSSDRLFGLCAALAAAALSAGYVHAILRGGPRIIDATSYWLEARALGSGWLAWPLAEPEQAVLGRFLLRTPAPVGLAAALGFAPAAQALGPGVMVIFPPGYPALLALGMRLGAPLAVGPVLAAALVLATMALARAVCRSASALGLPVGADGRTTERVVVRSAALFSVLCAALRYHTADTMSHGLAALCFATALAALLTAALPATGTRRRAGLAALAGLATGWLAATRPASALALGSCLVALGAGLALRSRRKATAPPARGAGLATPSQALTLARRVLPIALFAAALVPGLGLWAAHQKAATGSVFGSAQGAYYELSDGPGGCFRYGFGRGIGCLGEHGDFVRANLSKGFGLGAVLGTTLRRVQMHLSDALDFAPLFLLVPLGAWLGRRAWVVRLLALGVVLQVAAYAPFYFDGNYPGGGARMFADVLPLEHVLAALALGLLAARAPRGRPSLSWLTSGAVLLAGLGFAFQAGADHAQLRERNGGRPLFEPAELGRAHVQAGLVLVDTDAGFDLGHEPGSLSAPPGTLPSAPLGSVVVARARGDDLDRLVWESLGRPPTFRYGLVDPPAQASVGSVSTPGPAEVRISPVLFDLGPSEKLPLHIEGETLWPPRAQHGSWAWPEAATLPCATGSRWLLVRPPADGERNPSRVGIDESGPPRSVTLTLPAQALGGRKLRPRLALPPEQAPGPEPRRSGSAARPSAAAASSTAELVLRGDGRELARWSLPARMSPNCLLLERASVPTGLRELELEIQSSHTLALDAIEATAALGGPASPSNGNRKENR